MVSMVTPPGLCVSSSFSSGVNEGNCISRYLSNLLKR
jgi:hypothetical protein